MNIQWYPGHMTKARRQMQEDLKVVDLVIELLDARVPISSRNPDINTLCQGKGRLVLLVKPDLADEEASRKWKAYLRSQGQETLALDARTRSGMKEVEKAILHICQDKLEAARARGIKNRPIRAMVAGIPNVGKSTFINSFAGRAVTKTGNRPGVTKGKQWIRLNKDVELLDTPGILWPKFEDMIVGEHLAMIGSLKDELVNLEELSLHLITLIKERYPFFLEQRYGISEEGAPVEILEGIARVRGCLLKGQETDYGKAARLVFDDFRSGRLGRITLEGADENS